MSSSTILQRTVLVFLALQVIDLNTSVAQVTAGRSAGFGISSSYNTVSNASGQTPYQVELPPGEAFSGSWFYFSGSSLELSASLEEVPSVPWLSLSPSSFTSTACDDIQHVTYSFIAPATPGTYTTTIEDTNGSWGAVEVTLIVTNSPSVNESLSVEANVGEDKIVDFDSQGWLGFGAFSCVSNFTPGQSINATLKSLAPSSEWFELDPSSYTVAFGDTVNVIATFHASEPGDQTSMVIEEKQFFSWPKYYFVELKTNNNVAWGNAGGGAFADSLNWIGERVPDSDQTALFDASFYATSKTSSNEILEPLSVSFSTTTTNGGLTIGDARVHFDLQAHSYGINTLTFAGSGNLPDDSQLEIISGALGVTNPVGIGTGGFTGQLLVSTGGIFEVNSDPTGPSAVTVGSGDCGGGDCGRLVIQNGAKVNTNFAGGSIGSSGGTGSVFLSGTGSEWSDSSLVTVGRDGGAGLFEVKESASYYGNILYVAFGDSAEGSVTVDGEESLFALSDELSIGTGLNSGGNLTISGGALATIESNVSAGVAGGEGEILVTGSESMLIALDTTFVGNTGSGGVSVLDGGSMSSGTALIAGTNHGIGSALVDGISSSWTVAATLSIGLAGVGFARVTDNGNLAANEIEVGPLGSIEASGGTLIVGGTVITEGHYKSSARNFATTVTKKSTSGTIQTNTLALSDGAEIIADSVVFEDGGSLRADGVFPFDVVNSGGVNPGNKVGSTGLLTIDGNYAQLASGTLFIELNGDVAGSGFDQLVVNGDVQLEGTLNVSILDGHEPEVGQVYEILIAQNVSGVLDSIVTEEGVVVSVAYFGDRITLEIISFVNVGVEDPEVLTDFSLEQNYPNPVSHSTDIPFRMRERAAVKLLVYNSLGQVVAVLINRTMEPGSHTVTWQPENEASGIYFYRLVASNSIDQSRKMIVVR